MSDKEKLTEDFFNVKCRCEVTQMGKYIDTMYGVVPIEITEEQIEQLKQGKVLYTDDGEYTTIIRLAERKE